MDVIFFENFRFFNRLRKKGVKVVCYLEFNDGSTPMYLMEFSPWSRKALITDYYGGIYVSEDIDSLVKRIKSFKFTFNEILPADSSYDLPFSEKEIY